MPLSDRELISLASQDYILGNATADEQIDFISDQIANPFDSGSTNYFKKLRESVTNADQLDEICTELFSKIEDRYPDIEFDFSEYDGHLDKVFSVVYKFFIKNIQKNMLVFLREYIYNTKNRKYLVAEYANVKMPNYPKEQYGKKEFYILLTKLTSIVKDIGREDIKLSKFISYIERAGDAPSYFDDLKALLDKEIVCDHGVVRNFFDELVKSEDFNELLCKLQTSITKDIIIPYLEEAGVSELRIPPSDPIDDGTDDEDDDE